MSNQQLIQQVEQALQDNDQQTLRLLLLDEEQNFVSALLNLIKQDLKKPYLQFLGTWKAQRKQNDQNKQSSDQIRSINAVLHQESQQQDDNPVHRQIKKKKPIKLDEKFGYGYYGNVKCLMNAYGDFSPLQQSIKMMHSQIQVLFEQFIKFVLTIGKNSKLSGEAALNQALKLIFKQECTSFEQISKQYKKATKCTQSKQQLQLQQSEQDDFPEQKSQENDQHMSANTLQQSEYLAQLTKNMNEQEYEQYSSYRQVSFVQATTNKKNIAEFNKFVRYLDPDNKLLKSQMKCIHLISFICCRLVRRIIFAIVRIRKNGKLEPIGSPITYEEVLKVGNQLIEQYEKRFIQANDKLETIEQKAKKAFLQDFDNPKFRTLLPKKYTENRKGQDVWDQCPHYRQMWIYRCQGQIQIQNTQNVENGEQYCPKSGYCQYILENMNEYKKKGGGYLWQKYFGQQKIERREVGEGQNEENKGKTRKRVKLESLK